MKSSSCLDESLSTIPMRVLLKRINWLLMHHTGLFCRVLLCTVMCSVKCNKNRWRLPLHYLESFLGYKNLLVTHNSLDPNWKAAPENQSLIFYSFILALNSSKAYG